ncbi:hypothetical protein N0V83_008773 [Neocucurbitaria cava]|uniref:Shugoshin n=1 Tax=Neocucurbitaria cava TaxID=798079 RepID=A0A9W8Y3M2_9PLEO|nr:hypothetical protein N0V83_008773 [Neocucurbitaria cava]
MARLNEPPIAPQPSAETIDAVKRRFLRQNRELAKTNSQQSIRIRSLENDCSRLLAENLSLREQVLQLHNNIESRPAFDHIDAVKTQLEAKIQELGGLVAGLAKIKRGDEKGRRKSLVAKRRSGGERQWRSGLGLQEVENGMMPTITEDKYYPRRTMGADELQEALDDPDSQSPDIGPPPVSRFENEEPIAFNPSPASEEQQGGIDEEGEPALSVNLETRKKRRESGPKLNIRRVSLFESPEEAEEGATKAIRTGAKRKFSVQEDADKLQSNGEPFRFSRRNTPSASETEASNEDSRPSSPERPVLGSSKRLNCLIITTNTNVAEPVNTDPVVSPKKQRSSVQEKPEKNSQPLSKPRGRSRLNITRNIAQPDFPPLQMPEPIQTAEIILDSLPPKTPAVEEIFSPPSTEPSTQRPESKDTPPPGDLSSSDQIGQAARPGRRSRPQVSYKEPSLHTKMRRPDAKLVDAVIDRRTSAEPQTAPSTAIKRESTGDLNWKPVSAVSGRGGEEEVEVGSPLRQKLDRRDIGHDSKTTPLPVEQEERSTASKAISALINETSIAKRKAAAPTVSVVDTKSASETLPVNSQEHSAPKEEPTIKQEAPEKDSLAVFDFTDSSPAEPSNNNPRTRINELAKAARNARRHSAMPAPTASVTFESRRADKAEGALPSLHKRTGSGNVKSNSTTSLGKSTTMARSSSVKERKPTSSSGGAVAARADTIDVKMKSDIPAAQEEGARVRERERETSSLRAERAASRRKSMML